MAPENKVRFGLTNVHIAPIIKTEDDKEIYGEVKRMRGAVELTLEPNGEMTPFYADNSVFHTFASNSGYEGSLNIAEIPEFFLTDILGEKKVDGVLAEDINAKAKHFALMFEFDGDVKATRHTLYNVSVSRPGTSSSTKTATAEPTTQELSFVASPTIDGVVKRSTTAETPDAVYDAWYDSV